jgi:hypothetical protein
MVRTLLDLLQPAGGRLPDVAANGSRALRAAGESLRGRTSQPARTLVPMPPTRTHGPPHPRLRHARAPCGREGPSRV